jgi:transposase
MPQTSPYHIILTTEEREELEKITRKYTAPYCDVIRAKVILMAAKEFENKQIAERLNLPRRIVSKWRKRFFEERLSGLDERPRRGRPPVFSPSDCG